MGSKTSGRRTVGRIFRRPNGVYFLRYQAAGKDVRHCLDTTNRETAKAKAAEYLHPVTAQTEVDQRRVVALALQTAEEALAQAKAEKDRIRLADVWDKHPYDKTSPNRGASRKLSPRNVEENRLAWSKFVVWMKEAHADAEYMESVTPAMAEEYSRHMLDVEHLTGGRHNKRITTVRVMYRRAKRPDPFTDVKRQEVTHESRRNLEVDELRTVCTRATGELRRLFAVMLYTGLRLGDAVTLEWKSIQRGRIIRRMAKTRKDVSFPVHATLAAVLAEVPEEERSGAVCPALAAEYEKHHEALSRRIRRHLEHCELTCVEDGAGRQRRISRLGAHAFRHAFITECARAGVPEGAIRDWVGHASVEITRIYQHWSQRESDGRILAALPADVVGALPEAKPDPAAADREEVRRLALTAAPASVRAALAALRAEGNHAEVTP